MKKTVLITGANSGVGKSLTLLCAKADYNAVMVCRNREKGESVKREITEKTSSGSVHLLTADLSSIKSIKSLAEEFKTKFGKLDILVNNAGLSLPEREVSADGIEKVFATNHIGYFLLTNLLLECLNLSQNPRIINVASQAHMDIDFDDIMSEKNYNQYKTYGRSKMANIMFTYELAERLKDTGITVNCVHPGVVRTNIYTNVPYPAKLFIMLMKPFFISASTSAKKLFPMIDSVDFKNVTGKYFIKGKEAKSKESSYDKDSWLKLWKLSEKLILKTN